MIFTLTYIFVGILAIGLGSIVFQELRHRRSVMKSFDYPRPTLTIMRGPYDWAESGE